MSEETKNSLGGGLKRSGTKVGNQQLRRCTTGTGEHSDSLSPIPSSMVRTSLLPSGGSSGAPFQTFTSLWMTSSQREIGSPSYGPPR